MSQTKENRVSLTLASTAQFNISTLFTLQLGDGSPIDRRLSETLKTPPDAAVFGLLLTVSWLNGDWVVA